VTLDDLSANFAHLDRTTLLADWSWLIGAGRLPVMLTMAGDLFVQDAGTGAVFFLDTVEGTCTHVAADGADFQSLLTDRSFVADHFSFYLIAPLLKAGRDLPPGKLWGWVTPPVLGGEIDANNLEPTDIEVHFSILGQIWKQVKDLPPGTTINNVKIE